MRLSDIRVVRERVEPEAELPYPNTGIFVGFVRLRLPSFAGIGMLS